MKTVIIYETFTDPIKFIVADGDLSRFDKLMINSTDDSQALQDELTNMLYDPVTGDNTAMLNSAQDDFPLQAVKDGAIVIVCGFIP